MAEYTLVPGTFKVELDKATYRPGETVTVKVAYDVSKSGWTSGSWSINASVYDNQTGKLLDVDGETNFETTTQSISTLDNPKIHPRFKMPSGYSHAYIIRVVLDADGVEFGHVYKSVYVAEEGEEEPEPTGKFTLAPGSFQVRPKQSSYRPNDTVELAIAYDVSISGFSGEMTWSINTSVYLGSKLLDKDGETNAVTTRRSISSLSSPKLHPRFKMSNTDMPITVKLEAVYSPALFTPKTVLLGILNLTIPVTSEAPATDFTLLAGSFKVVPNSTKYKPGATVKLFVGYDVTRNSSVGVSWSVNASVFDSSGKFLDRDGETNAFTTSRSVSSADVNAKVHPHFKMGSADMLVRVVLDADGLELAQTTVNIPVSTTPENGDGGGNGGEEPPEEEEGEGINWWLWGGIVLIAVGVVLFFLARRRGYRWA